MRCAMGCSRCTRRRGATPIKMQELDTSKEVAANSRVIVFFFISVRFLFPETFNITLKAFYQTVAEIHGFNK